MRVPYATIEESQKPSDQQSPPVSDSSSLSELRRESPPIQPTTAPVDSCPGQETQVLQPSQLSGTSIHTMQTRSKSGIVKPNTSTLVWLNITCLQSPRQSNWH